MNAAHHMDVAGNKSAKDDIAAIKIAAPKMAKTVIDRAMQMHGGAMCMLCSVVAILCCVRGIGMGIGLGIGIYTIRCSRLCYIRLNYASTSIIMYSIA